MANEILMANNAVRNLIREDKIAQLYSVMQTSQSRQMHTLEQSVESWSMMGRSVSKQPSNVPLSNFKRHIIFRHS